MILDLLLSLIPWQLVAGIVLLTASVDTLLIALWHAAITNPNRYR